MSILRAFQVLGLLSFAAVAMHFFETFPNGWDQTEYCWAVQADYLPHAPYIAHYLVGRLLSIPLGAAVAFSLLSFASSIVVLWLLYGTALRLLSREAAPDSRDRWAATLAAVLVGSSFLFLRHAVTQEAYMLQCALLLGAARCAVGTPGSRTWLLGGALAGGAVAAHSASLFVMPALLYLALWQSSGANARQRWEWLAGFVVTVGAAILGIWALFPGGEPGLLPYLRGISPVATLAKLGDPAHLWQSAGGLLDRLIRFDIPMSRMPVATGPTGMSVVHVAVVVLGMPLALVYRRRVGICGALWAIPFLLYEIGIGKSIDWGTYVVFVLPPLGLFAAVLFRRILALSSSDSGWRHAERPLVVALVVAAVFPSLVLLGNHWRDLESDRIAHFSDTAIAAMWIREHLSERSLALQPATEGNVNLLPYYARRQHAFRRGNRILVFEAFGTPFAPLNIRSYSLLTTEALSTAITAGRDVYALEPDPLEEPAREIDPTRFVWRPVHVVELDAVAARHDLPVAVQRRVAGKSATLYSAELVGSSSEQTMPGATALLW